MPTPKNPPPNDSKDARPFEQGTASTESKPPSYKARIDVLTPTGEYCTLAKVLPSGSLQARRLSNGGVKLYWRFAFEKRSDREEIGLYDSSLPIKTLFPHEGRWTVNAALRQAGDWSLTHAGALKLGGFRGVLKAKAAAEVAKSNQERLDATATLKALLDAYCDRLEQLGRKSHAAVRKTLKLHVVGPFETLANRPARDVSGEDIADVLRLIHKQKRTRQPGKVRAYIHAAYEVARRARVDPQVEEAFKRFQVRSNPASETPAEPAGNGHDKNPLSIQELQCYWELIKPLTGLRGTALRLHLLTGGQRIEQLVRVLSANVTCERILIWDIKGRSAKPRAHEVPLVGLASTIYSELDLKGKFALSSNGGKSAIANTTLSNWAIEVVNDQIPNFRLKRVRSGVETLLASRQVSKEYRGRLQSHGLGGVQDKHYDGYNYILEKRQALQVLHDTLSGHPKISAGAHPDLDPPEDSNGHTVATWKGPQQSTANDADFDRPMAPPNSSGSAPNA